MFYKKSESEIKREAVVRWGTVLFVIFFIGGVVSVYQADQTGLNDGIAPSTWVVWGLLLLFLCVFVLAELRLKKKVGGAPGLEFFPDHAVIQHGMARETLSFYAVSDLTIRSFPGHPSSQIVLAIRGKNYTLQGYEGMEKIVSKVEKAVGKETKIHRVSSLVYWHGPLVFPSLLFVILAASVTGLHFYLENHELTGLIIPLVFLSVGSILLFYFKPIGNFLGRLNAYWPWNPWPFFLGKLSTLLSGGFWFVFGLELLFWQIWRFNLIRTFIEWPQTWKVVSAILVLSGLGLLIFIKKAAKKLTEIESNENYSRAPSRMRTIFEYWSLISQGIVFLAIGIGIILNNLN